MTKAPEFTLQSIPNQQTYKIIAIGSFMLAIVVAAVAITLYVVKEVDSFTFNLLLAISGFMLLEAVLLPALLKRFAKGPRYQFYEDHLKYQIMKQGFFTIPYAQITGIRREPIEKTHHYRNKMVSDIYLKMDETKIPDFPNTYIKKGELILPAIPDDHDPVRKISALLERA